VYFANVIEDQMTARWTDADFAHSCSRLRKTSGGFLLDGILCQTILTDDRRLCYCSSLRSSSLDTVQIKTTDARSGSRFFYWFFKRAPYIKSHAIVTTNGGGAMDGTGILCHQTILIDDRRLCYCSSLRSSSLDSTNKNY
jgi:hypothetical protein